MNADPAAQFLQPSRAFSLVELLVAVGLIALMAAGIGVALRGSGSTSALQNAQGVVAGVVTAARMQAMAQNASVRIMIDADPASEGYLRTCRILVSTGGAWRQAGSPATLPAGTYVVPSAEIAGATFSEVNGPWPEARRSSLTKSPEEVPLVSRSGEDGNSERAVWTVFDFNGQGLPSLRGTVRLQLIVGVARRAADALVFENPELVRGVMVTDYGVPLLLNQGDELVP